MVYLQLHGMRTFLCQVTDVLHLPNSSRRYDVTLGLCFRKATLALNWLESYRKIGKPPSNRLTRFMEIGGRVGVGGGRGAGREVAFSNLEIPNTTFIYHLSNINDLDCCSSRLQVHK